MQPSQGKRQVRRVLQFCSDLLRSVSILSLIAATLSKLVPSRPCSGKEFRDVATVTQVVWDLFEDIPHLLRGRVKFFSMNKFIERIALAKLDGGLLKVINHIERNDLVIFDDFGQQPLDNNSRLALLQILEDCYQRKSV